MSTYKSRAKSAVKASSRRERLPAELSRVNFGAAGVDVGASSHFVAVPEGRCEQPVREFASFTADLYRLAEGDSGDGVHGSLLDTTLRSPGRAGIPGDAGPRRIKNVPGRKSDVLECSTGTRSKCTSVPRRGRSSGPLTAAVLGRSTSCLNWPVT